MTLANTAIVYNSANKDLSISEMQLLACQFHKSDFNFERENTDLSISEVFFNKILGFCSVPLRLRGRLNNRNWVTFDLTRPKLSLYGIDRQRWLYNDLKTLLIYFLIYSIYYLIFI